MTIPRLELAAAVKAVKLDKLLKKYLHFMMIETVFWTDSMIVFWYMHNEDKRYQTYVTNRVTFIRETTARQQWKHVGIEDNPVDYVSRGLTSEDLPSHAGQMDHSLAGLLWTIGPHKQTLEPLTWKMAWKSRVNPRSMQLRVNNQILQMNCSDTILRFTACGRLWLDCCT